MLACMLILIVFSNYFFIYIGLNLVQAWDEDDDDNTVTQTTVRKPVVKYVVKSPFIFGKRLGKTENGDKAPGEPLSTTTYNGVTITHEQEAALSRIFLSRTSEEIQAILVGAALLGVC